MIQGQAIQGESIRGRKENRTFPRVSSEALLQWKKISDDEFFRAGAEGMTKNISGGGICFSTPEPLNVGEMVALNLTLDDFPATVLALGRVVRVTGASQPTGPEVAVEFWWIGWDDETAQKAIGDYIRTKLDRA